MTFQLKIEMITFFSVFKHPGFHLWEICSRNSNTSWHEAHCRYISHSKTLCLVQFMAPNFSLWRLMEDFVLPSFRSILTPVMGKWSCWVIDISCISIERAVFLSLLPYTISLYLTKMHHFPVIKRFLGKTSISNFKLCALQWNYSIDWVSQLQCVGEGCTLDLWVTVVLGPKSWEKHLSFVLYKWRAAWQHPRVTSDISVSLNSPSGRLWQHRKQKCPRKKEASNQVHYNANNREWYSGERHSE